MSEEISYNPHKVAKIFWTPETVFSIVFLGGRGMVKRKSFAVILITICLSSFSFAKSNPIIGKWRWSSTSCDSPDLIFESTQIRLNGDADGTGFKHLFKNIKYRVNGKEIEVDFGEPHGFGKAPDKNKLSFKILNPDRFEMIRKTKSMNEINRCK